ncbi:hypothetical protein E8E14_012210 [Neopestalotiopsis sp. 37M]|nr:hypothetical protein E8E14_012210 [Neopestalotiopsis sp. 37M]
MHIMYSFIGLAFAPVLAVAGVSGGNSTVQCAKGLKMFVARGTDEPEWLGETGKLVKVIAEQIPGSDYEAIKYPASMNNPNYFESVGNGTQLVRKVVTDYFEACPESKIALFGYSQGAQVVSNSLCGMAPVWALYAGFDGGDTSSEEAKASLIEYSSPLPTNVTQNVVAAVLFGDPSHRDGALYNYGNSTGQGIYWRADIRACEALGDRLRSYCDAGDPFCAVGYLDPAAHLTYVINHGTEIAEYVREQYINSVGSGVPFNPSADQCR